MRHKHPVKFKNLSKLNEDEVDTTAFQTFMHNANELYKQAEAKVKDMNNDYIRRLPLDEIMYQFYMQLLRFMKLNQDCIQYVNQGSSRIVFALTDGTALKVAKSDAGFGQNKVEVANCMNPKMKYSIFPDFYDADKKKYLALNCEMCANTTDDEIKSLLGADLNNLMSIIKFIIRQNVLDKDYVGWKDYLINDKSKDPDIKEEFKQKAKVLDGLISQKTEAFKALASLVEFWRKNGLDSMLPDDLESCVNWGITVRNNQLVPVIIDAGFSQDVVDNYYRE